LNQNLQSSGDGRRREVALKWREPAGFCTPATWHSVKRAIWPRSIAHWPALGTEGVSNDYPNSRSRFGRGRVGSNARSRPPPLSFSLPYTLGVDILTQFSAAGCSPVAPSAAAHCGSSRRSATAAPAAKRSGIDGRPVSAYSRENSRDISLSTSSTSVRTYAAGDRRALAAPPGN
jgi:hypothetical protein